MSHNVLCANLEKQQRYCPPGEKSRCKWQQDQATGIATYKSNECLPEVLLEVLRPVFVLLSETKRLQRCVRGTIQNPNECINSLIWARCTKHKHHGAKVVRFAVASAVCHLCLK